MLVYSSFSNSSSRLARQKNMHIYNIGDEVEFWIGNDKTLFQGVVRGKYEFNQYLVKVENKKEFIVLINDIKGLIGDLTKTTEYINDR